MRAGTLIRQWRVVAEIGVRELAAEIGISAATLSRFERGESIDGATMVKIMHWLFAQPVKE